MPLKDLEKRRAYQREYGKKHRERRRSYYREKSRIRRIELRKWYGDLKESEPCMDCGKYFPYWVMEFDHVRGEKVSHVSHMVNSGASRSVLLKEIKKCDPVCKNCHADRTHEREKPWVRFSAT